MQLHDLSRHPRRAALRERIAAKEAASQEIAKQNQTESEQVRSQFCATAPAKENASNSEGDGHSSVYRGSCCALPRTFPLPGTVVAPQRSSAKRAQSCPHPHSLASKRHARACLAGGPRGVPVYGPTAAADAQQDQHASSVRTQSGVPVRRPTAAANARGGQCDEPSLWGHSDTDGAASALADLAELQRSGLHVVWPRCLREQAPAAQVKASGVMPEGMAVCTDTRRPQAREGGAPAADGAALLDWAELQELGCRVVWPV